MHYIGHTISGRSAPADIQKIGDIIYGGGDVQDKLPELGDAKIIEVRIICGRQLFDRLERFTGRSRLMRSRLYTIILQAAADALDGKDDDQRPIGEIVAERIRKTVLDVRR